MKPFEQYDELLAAYTPAFRCVIDAHGDAAAGEWRLLELSARDRNERLNGYDPVFDFEPPKRHRPSLRSTAATTTASGAVVLSSSDPLKRILPIEYVAAMTGEAVPANGFICCPLHDDHTPSFKVYPDHWHCFGCHTTGGVYELGSRLSGLSTRGPEFLELRRWIADALLQHKGGARHA